MQGVELWYPTRNRLTRETARWAIWMGQNFPKVEQFIGPDLPYCQWGPDRARNRIVQSFLTREAEWLWMVDADTVPPKDKRRVKDFLYKRQEVVVTGVTDGYNAYHGEDLPPGGWLTRCGQFPSLYRWEYDNEGKINGWNPLEKGSDYSEAEACGAACLKVHRSVFKRLTKPYFLVAEDNFGEDLFFCAHLKAEGIDLKVDTNITCSHWKEIELRADDA